jgi:anti-sigma factor RsiW
MEQAELIVAYLRGQLPEQQRQDFEQRLSTDSDLQLAVKDYQTILEGFKGIKHHVFEQEVGTWDTEEELDEEGGQILAYLQNKLNPSEKEAFENRMVSEPQLAEKVTNFQPLMEGFKSLRQDDFAAEVSEWAKELPSLESAPEAKVVPISNRRFKWRSYAAAAILLAVVAASIWLIGSFSDPNAAYMAFREANYIQPGVEAIRGEEETLSQAEVYLATGKYPAAVELLQSILREDSLFVEAQYLLGHAYYQMDEYQLAITTLSQNQVLSQGSTAANRQINPDNAGWTLIMAQLALFEQTADLTAKENLLNTLSTFLDAADRNDTYYAKALKLEQLLNQ